MALATREDLRIEDYDELLRWAAKHEDRATQVHPDLSPAGYLILRLLKDQGAIRASVIAEHFESDKGAVSRQVQLAIDLGLVERSTDPADRRASLLQLTEAGGAGLLHVDAVRRERLKERLGEWDDASLAHLVDTLGRYNEVFEDLDQCF